MLLLSLFAGAVEALLAGDTLLVFGAAQLADAGGRGFPALLVQAWNVSDRARPCPL